MLAADDTFWRSGVAARCPRAAGARHFIGGDVVGSGGLGRLLIGLWGANGRQVRTDRGWCVEQSRARIEATDWKQAREDVRRFVKPNELPSLDLRSREFFLAQCEKLL